MSTQKTRNTTEVFNFKNFSFNGDKVRYQLPNRCNKSLDIGFQIFKERIQRTVLEIPIQKL